MTYVAIDTPLFSTLQWLYLSSVLGESEVHLVTRPGEPIQAGRINLVPVTRLADVDVRGDLFVSTWALSESSEAAQQFVEDKAWFGATSLLMAYQCEDPCFPAAKHVAERAAVLGGRIVPIPRLPANAYVML